MRRILVSNFTPVPVRRALILNFTLVPVMEGLRKDHKGNIHCGSNLGPKLRPLCAANRAPNSALGEIIAKVVKAVADSVVSKNGNGEVISTEELKHSIEEQKKARDNNITK